MECVRLGGIEAGFGRCVLGGEREKGADCLADLGPSERPFVAVVIGRIDALGDTLDAGDRLDRAAVLRGNARTDDSCERPVVRLDTP